MFVCAGERVCVYACVLLLLVILCFAWLPVYFVDVFVVAVVFSLFIVYLFACLILVVVVSGFL